MKWSPHTNLPLLVTLIAGGFITLSIGNYALDEFAIYQRIAE